MFKSSGLEFNRTLSECMRELHGIVRQLNPYIDALELIGAERIAEGLSSIQSQIIGIDEHLTQSYGGHIRDELEESQATVGRTLMALLDASSRPRRVSRATVIGSLVVAHDDLPEDVEIPEDPETGPDAEIPVDPETGARNA